MNESDPNIELPPSISHDSQKPIVGKHDIIRMLRTESYRVDLPDQVAEAIFSVLCKKGFLKTSPNGHVDLWFSPEATSYFFPDAAVNLRTALDSHESGIFTKWFHRIIRHPLICRSADRSDQSPKNSDDSLESHAKSIHLIREELQRLRYHRKDIFDAFGADSENECRTILAFLFRKIRRLIPGLEDFFVDLVKEREREDGSARLDERQVVAGSENAFYRESNNLWLIRVEDKKERFKNVLGFFYLHQVFSNPGREIWPTEFKNAKAAGGLPDYLPSEQELDDVDEALVKELNKRRRPPWLLRGEDRQRYHQLKREVDDIRKSVPKGNSPTENQRNEIDWRIMDLKELLGDLSREQKAANSIRNRVKEAKKELKSKEFNRLLSHLEIHLPKISAPIIYNPGQDPLFTQSQLSPPPARK